MAKREIKRTSCGYCTDNTKHKHADCPGTIRGAMGGLDWVCWCSENGHPETLPAPPKTFVEVDDTATPAEPHDEPRTTTGAPKAERQPKAPREKAPRCGAPTGRGPCKRKEGHTAGHDGR